MALVKIPINSKLYLNIDEAAQKKSSPERFNTFIDESGTSRRRPGLSEWIRVAGSKPIDGWYYWAYLDRLIVSSNGNLHSIDSEGNQSIIGTSVITAGVRTIFDEAVYPTRKLFAASGGPLTVTDGATSSRITDVNAPQLATHLNIFDTYLLANQTGSQKVEYSGVGTPEVFTSEYFTVETKSDDIVAIGCSFGEIACFGKESVEFRFDDGSTPFRSLDGSNIEDGTLSPYSIIFVDNSWFYLNNEKRVVRLAGRQPKVISVPVDSYLQGLTTISDVISDVMTVGGRTFLVFTFPTENKTIVYDYALNEWVSEWSWWNRYTSKHQRWRGNCCIYIPEWGKHLVGDYSNGKIYESSFDTYQDDGIEIRSIWRTGWIDHDTVKWKRSLSIKVRIRRGDSQQTSVNPVLMIRWRDNGSKIWGNTVNIDLGGIGEYELYRTIQPMGRYISRQYELSITDNCPLSLVDMYENVVA